jgi:hypothetical protein
VTAVIKPGRELSGTGLAQIAVFQLPVAQQTDLAAAYGTFFLFKQFSKETHSMYLQL